MNTKDSSHDLSLKLSPCMCTHSSCPGWRNDCNLLAYVLCGEDLATYTLSRLACGDKSMLCANVCAAHLGLPHDDQSSDHFVHNHRQQNQGSMCPHKGLCRGSVPPWILQRQVHDLGILDHPIDEEVSQLVSEFKTSKCLCLQSRFGSVRRARTKEMGALGTTLIPWPNELAPSYEVLCELELRKYVFSELASFGPGTASEVIFSCVLVVMCL